MAREQHSFYEYDSAQGLLCRTPIAELEKLLQDKKVLPNTWLRKRLRNNAFVEGQLLYFAIIDGNLAHAELLLKYGGDPNSIYKSLTYKNGKLDDAYTAYSFALTFNDPPNFSMMKLLLNNGVDIDIHSHNYDHLYNDEYSNSFDASQIFLFRFLQSANNKHEAITWTKENLQHLIKFFMQDQDFFLTEICQNRNFDISTKRMLIMRVLNSIKVENIKTKEVLDFYGEVLLDVGQKIFIEPRVVNSHIGFSFLKLFRSDASQEDLFKIKINQYYESILWLRKVPDNCRSASTAQQEAGHKLFEKIREGGMNFRVALCCAEKLLTQSIESGDYHNTLFYKSLFNVVLGDEIDEQTKNNLEALRATFLNSLSVEEKLNSVIESFIVDYRLDDELYWNKNKVLDCVNSYAVMYKDVELRLPFKIALIMSVLGTNDNPLKKLNNLKDKITRYEIEKTFNRTQNFFARMKEKIMISEDKEINECYEAVQKLILRYLPPETAEHTFCADSENTHQKLRQP